jgi:carbonic anhydrase
LEAAPRNRAFPAVRNSVLVPQRRIAFRAGVQRLTEGIHKFRNEEFGDYEELFQRLAREGQNPHSLFITCSDSRVLAELITQSKPGDLFVVKNVGNIVPPYNSSRAAVSTGAAIEFAVEALGVEDIVVCGHSQCGAMRALLDEPDLSRMPNLEEWLLQARPVRETVLQRYQHLEAAEHRYNAAAEENVLFALENLKTFPCVQRRLEEGTLRLHGWFFKIAGAELHAYDPHTRQFVPFGEEWQPDLDLPAP